MTAELRPRRGGGARPQPINHGSYGGYVTHRARGEEPCAECIAAHYAYKRSIQRPVMLPRQISDRLYETADALVTIDGTQYFRPGSVTDQFARYYAGLVSLGYYHGWLS